MDILPAIDLRNGKCVRLLQGDYGRQIDYADNPVAQARQFERDGAKWLHVVDLDGAKEGSQYNLKTLEQIRTATKLKIQVGGGIRSEATVKTILRGTGINRAIIGTKALEAIDWFRDLVDRYPHQIVLGLDARDGRIATHGWMQTSATTVEQMADIVNDWPLAAIVYTDIARDGMLAGPNIDATRRLAENCRLPVIASGGVGQLTDIKQLTSLPITGIIVGRALYEAKFTLRQALELV